MRKAGRLSMRGVWFLVVARPVFRAVDFYSSYAASVRVRGGRPDAAVLAALDARRRAAHESLAALSASHGEACAACRGGCCTQERFRYSIIDRLLADRETPNTAPRRLRDAGRERFSHYPPLRSGPPLTPGYCPRCTSEGCVMEPADRPAQCLAYQCRATVSMLDPEQIASGTRAVTDLMRVMVGAAHARR